MALAKHFLLLLGVFSFMDEVQGQLNPPEYGIELGVPGPSLRYPAVSLSAWMNISEKSAIAVEGGYGGVGLFFRREKIDQTYQRTHQRYFIALLYQHHVEASRWEHFDISCGPYYLSMQAEIGQNFIDDMPDGALIAHSGADYALKRYGLLPGIGWKTFGSRATFGVRAQVPVYYESSEFQNIRDPLLVLDFDPMEKEIYQQELSRVSMDFVISASIGILFFAETKEED